MPWSTAMFRWMLPLFLCPCALASASPAVKQCVPILWTGGPLEIAWRTHSKTLPADSAVRDALNRWYEPSTLDLLDGSPANCLLVTWSAGADAEIESQQHQFVKTYAVAAHKRGLAVLGLIYAEGDPAKIADDAFKASLDGLVLDGDFKSEFVAALHTDASPMPTIEIAKDAASARSKPGEVIALRGVAPSGRNLSEMGIRGSPSSQPWVESNIWLVKSFSAGPLRTIWISSQLEIGSPIDYERVIADASAAGGRWIVSIDDSLRAQLLARDLSALKTWRLISSYLNFAKNHTLWRSLAPYGNVGIVLDPASSQADRIDEYLKLATRRQVPYQLLSRSDLNSGTLAKFRAIVATEVDPPSAAEHKVLQDFAEDGGIVLTAPSWGNAPETEPFSEIPIGKGSVIVYKDPDPDAVAKDLKELLSDDDLGVVPFNVPSVITSASGGVSDQPLVIQLVNYFDHPVEAITLRVKGRFHSARLETPDGDPMDLPLRSEDGRTEVTIPKLLLWGAVSMQ